MTTIIGVMNAETRQIGLYPKAVNRSAQPDDIVLSHGDFHRMVWNHNGQRLTSVLITDLVMAAWEDSEAVSEAIRLESLVRAALVEPLAAAISQRNAASEAVQ